MSNCAVVGINWGDEGKGRMVDLLTSEYDIVIRYQGGGNAGHTVVNDKGKFALHILPSGIFREDVINILGNGVAVDPENLVKEINELKMRNIEISSANLKNSERASLLLPWHRLLDELEETRLKEKKYGSTKQGIAPFYADKFRKKTVLAGELLYDDALRAHLYELMEWTNLHLKNIYGHQGYTKRELDEWISSYGEELKPYICNTVELLQKENKRNKKILFEAQLGSLRDIDYGIYPYTTSSSTISAYAPIGAGCPFIKIDKVIGVVKAYSTCVGEGPFVSEMFDEFATKLREVGQEYGAKTGRPRRVGAFDIPATKYGVMVQNATEIALTKLDVLSEVDEIPVCTHYLIDGEKCDDFPFPLLLNKAKPVIRYFKGWKCDISNVRTWDELPKQAKDYVTFIENEIGCRISHISVGPERESIILKGDAND